MRSYGTFQSGCIAAIISLFGEVAAASDITVTRKLADQETLETTHGGQIEIDFEDGSVLVVGSASLAQLESSAGVLNKLELVTGVFEVATASGKTISFQTGVCEVDAIDASVQTIVGPLSTTFIFQSGAAVLIRSSAGLTNLTSVGTSVDVACGTDGSAGDVRDISKVELIAINQKLGQPDEIKVVDLANAPDDSGPGDSGNSKDIDVSGFAPSAFLLPVSTAPGIEFSESPPLIVSTAPAIGGDTEEICCFDQYFWTGPSEGGNNGSGGSGGEKPVEPEEKNPTKPKQPDPFDLSLLTPAATQVGVFPSNVYDARVSAKTDEIFFALDPAARTASPDPSILNEGLKIGPGNFAKLNLSENFALTRLSVDGENKDYVTFTYRNMRYALISGTHSTGGALATDASGLYVLDDYDVFRLTSGAVESLSGFANGIGIDEANSAYVNITSADLRISPNLTTDSGSGGVEIGPGVDASVSLDLDGVAASTLTLFGSAKDDQSHYVDLASQETGSDQISLASGEAVPGLNVPASVAKYGSYLDWGIIRGRISAGNQTAQLLPTPWVAGREWSPSDLEGFTGTATYKGHTFGNVIDQNGARNVFGSYDNSWDFGAGTGTVNIDFDGTGYSGSTSRTAGTIGFIGDITATNRTGTLSGKFYGNSRPGVAPDALGGTFSITGTAADPYAANGVMAAEKQ